MSDLDNFAEAVSCGAKVFAGPETAKRAAWPYPVEEHSWIPEGVLYAIDTRTLGGSLAKCHVGLVSAEETCPQ